MAGQFIGVNGVARKVKNQFIGVNGVARKVKNGFIGVNGVARKCYGGGLITVSGSGLNYGQTIPNWSRVTGTVTIGGSCKFYYGNGQKMGELWPDSITLSIDTSGSPNDTWFGPYDSRVYVEFEDDGYNFDGAELSLTFGTSALSGSFTVEYSDASDNGSKYIILSSSNVSFDLTFET